jgi:hypothetical protein
LFANVEKKGAPVGVCCKTLTMWVLIFGLDKTLKIKHLNTSVLQQTPTGARRCVPVRACVRW